MLGDTDRQILLKLARESIRCGLDYGNALSITAADYPESIQQKLACFVTLHKHGELRGCIGNLAACQALVKDVTENAFNAAFRDPRFAALQADELDKIHIHIEILSPTEPLEFTSEENLLNKMRPDIDGLVLSDGMRRGTFLPTVWQALPHRKDFLAQLKKKAGLPATYWSDNIRIERYTTESFEE